MSASLSRHATQAVASSSGDGILFPVVVASTVAVAAGVSLAIRPKRNGGGTDSKENSLGSQTVTIDAVDQESSSVEEMTQELTLDNAPPNNAIGEEGGKIIEFMNDKMHKDDGSGELWA